MSPDTVFAAQMWGWPDAVIKRDANGAVLFVNATFLALYGGRVEDWQGMGVTGWNAPPPAGQAQRFETRIPCADNSETVYDWLEAAGPDGCALAIAREITPFLPQPGDAAHAFQPPAFVPPAEQLPAVAASSFEAVMQAPAAEPATSELPVAETSATEVFAAQAPAVEAFAQNIHTPDAPVSNAPVSESPVFESPALEAHAFETPVSEPPVLETSGLETSVLETPAFETPAFEAPAFGAPAQADAAPLPPVAQNSPAPTIEITEFVSPHAEEPASAAPIEVSVDAPTPHEAPQAAFAEPPAPQQEERREFERRALPIEDGSAVLGNNWRDAVIAKAVGAQDPVVDDAPASEAAAPASADTIRILLAEDNAINALLTRTLLEAEGCHVDTVEDGQLAVEAMKVNTYNLIFMDMRMPNMDGLEATRKIRQMDHASKGLPIVALTANAFDDDRNACFDAGMNDFMTKPVSAEELSEMVSQWTSPQVQKKVAS